MYRFIFIFIDELERLMLSWNSRYIALSSWQKARYFSNFIGLMFLKSIERGERVFTSMQSRGYEGTLPDNKSIRPEYRDYIFLFITIIYFTGTEFVIRFYR
jgi:cobalt/nickel transport system permease protein